MFIVFKQEKQPFFQFLRMLHVPVTSFLLAFHFLHGTTEEVKQSVSMGKAPFLSGSGMEEELLKGEEDEVGRSNNNVDNNICRLLITKVVVADQVPPY